MHSEEQSSAPAGPGSLLTWALESLPGPRLLVVPSGTGRTAIAAARSGREVSGADRSPAHVNEARALLRDEEEAVRERTGFLVIEGPLPFEADMFDGALVDDVDIPGGELGRLLRDLERVVRAGGAIWVHCHPEAAPALIDTGMEAIRFEQSRAFEGGVAVQLRVHAKPNGGGATGGDSEIPPLEVRALLTALQEDQQRLARTEEERDSLRGDIEHARAAEAAHVLERQRLHEELDRLRLEIEETARLETELGEQHDRFSAMERELQEAVTARARAEEQLQRALRDVELARSASEQRVEETATSLAELESRLLKRDAELADAAAREQRTQRKLDDARKVIKRQSGSVAKLAELRGSRSYRLMQIAWAVKRRLRHPFGG